MEEITSDRKIVTLYELNKLFKLKVSTENGDQMICRVSKGDYEDTKRKIIFSQTVLKVENVNSYTDQDGSRIETRKDEIENLVGKYEDDDDDNRCCLSLPPSDTISVETYKTMLEKMDFPKNTTHNMESNQLLTSALNSDGFINNTKIKETNQDTICLNDNDNNNNNVQFTSKHIHDCLSSSLVLSSTDENTLNRNVENDRTWFKRPKLCLDTSSPPPSDIDCQSSMKCSHNTLIPSSSSSSSSLIHFL